MTDQNNQSGQNQTPLQQGEQTLVQFPKGQASSGTDSQSSDTSSQNVPQQIQQQPQGGPVKEQEPVASTSNVAEANAASQQEWVSPSEKSVELEPEVEESGVEETVNEPKLSAEDKIAGLQEAMETVPVSSAPTKKIKYPIDLDDAEKVSKGPLIFKNTGNAMLWLALLVLRQFKMRMKQGRES